MTDVLIATTSTQGLQPLGSAAQRSYELVSGALRDRLGADHAALLAEPVAAAHGDSIDWYAPGPGLPVALADLPEEEAQALRDRLAGLVGEIEAEAARLSASEAPEDQRLGEALAHAVELPGEEMIHALRTPGGGLAPVLVHWGWVRDEQRAVRGVLTGMVPRRGAAGPAAAAAVPGGVAHGAQTATPGAGGAVPAGLWWGLIALGWLLPALALGWIVWLLIAPCGLSQGRVIFCPEPAPGIAPAEAETRVIEDEIARLERELALLARTCQPTVPRAVPGTTPAPVPEPPAPQEDADARPFKALDPDTAPDSTEAARARDDAGRRAEARGALRGDLNFALEWATLDDLDLYVTCPSGETLSYLCRRACNGAYDLDANVARATAIPDPVENIVFDAPAPGRYAVEVRLRGARGAEGPRAFALHVLRKSGQSQTFTGEVSETRREWRKTIEITE